MSIFGEDGKMVVVINLRNGKVALGDPKHPTKSAEAFWRAVTATFGSMCLKGRFATDPNKS